MGGKGFGRAGVRARLSGPGVGEDGQKMGAGDKEDVDGVAKDSASA